MVNRICVRSLELSFRVFDVTAVVFVIFSFEIFVRKIWVRLAKIDPLRMPFV